MGMAGAGSNFFNCFLSTSLILLKLNGCQILKLDVLKVGIFTFSVLMALSKPLEYFLKYGGQLILGEKALHAVYSVTKISGGLSVFTWVWAEHLISICVGSSTDIAQLP